MKKRKRQKQKQKLVDICGFNQCATEAEAKTTIRLLAEAGIKAATDTSELRPGHRLIYTGKGIVLWVYKQDRERAHKVIDLAFKMVRERNRGPLKLPPDDSTLENLDMLIHDCRQYLMIATGELKDITEEGELDLDDPTNDIEKIEIRLKRLKSQCMRQAGRIGLDWEHGGGLKEV